MRLAAKTDANHAEIRDAFRRMGFTVADCARMGGGFPDLLISRAGQTALIEIKRDKKASLTPDQIDFHAKWQGPLHVVVSVDDAIRINQAMMPT